MSARASCLLHERNGGHHRPCVHCQNAELAHALRRLTSTETFTVALDLNHPTKVATQAVIDELWARMRFAGEVVAAYDAMRSGR